MRKELKDACDKAFENSIIDNDFERVYNIEFLRFQKVSKEELIEEVLRLRHILNENGVELI